MNDDSSSQEAPFQYFRIGGTVYLHVERVKEEFDGPDSAEKALPPSLDPLAIRLMHFRASLNYDTPPDLAFLKELVKIMEEVHLFHSLSEAQRAAIPLSIKKEVVISGADLEFTSDRAYSCGEKLRLKLSFPEYPFATVEAVVEVVSCEGGYAEDGFGIRVVYSNIPESDRDLIIKFVNYLQRKKLTEGKKSNY